MSELEELHQELESYKQLFKEWTEIEIESEAVFRDAVAYALFQLGRLPEKDRSCAVVLSLLLARGRECAQDISQQGHDRTVRKLKSLERHVRANQRPPDLSSTSRSPNE